jgi:hypothetical protein
VNCTGNKTKLGYSLFFSKAFSCLLKITVTSILSSLFPFDSISSARLTEYYLTPFYERLLLRRSPMQTLVPINNTFKAIDYAHQHILPLPLVLLHSRAVYTRGIYLTLILSFYFTCSDKQNTRLVVDEIVDPKRFDKQSGQNSKFSSATQRARISHTTAATSPFFLLL